MQLILHPLRHVSLDSLSGRDAELLLANMQLLERFATTGKTQTLLSGKNLGLVGESLESEDAHCFCRAAADLGARVACIRPELSDASSTTVVAQTARMLGRLYDGIECLGLEPNVVKRLRAAATVPVYGGIASPAHATARLAGQLGPQWSHEESRRRVIQTILLSTLN